MDETKKVGGILHYIEKKRVVTIIYRTVWGKIQYGASIFYEQSWDGTSHIAVIKRDNTKLARRRLLECPVVTDQSSINAGDLRRMLFSNGVQGKKDQIFMDTMSSFYLAMGWVNDHGGINHVMKGSRVITIVHRFIGNTVEYGAAVFHNPTWDRKQHLDVIKKDNIDLATRRMQMNPVAIVVTENICEKSLRKYMLKYGVQGKLGDVFPPSINAFDVATLVYMKKQDGLVNFIEKKRVITVISRIKYSKTNPTQMILMYGAAIFHEPTWDGKNQLNEILKDTAELARLRMTRNPVQLEVESNVKISKDKIRKLLFKYGVQERTHHHQIFPEIGTSRYKLCPKFNRNGGLYHLQEGQRIITIVHTGIKNGWFKYGAAVFHDKKWDRKSMYSKICHENERLARSRLLNNPVELENEITTVATLRQMLMVYGVQDRRGKQIQPDIPNENKIPNKKKDEQIVTGNNLLVHFMGTCIDYIKKHY